MKIALMRKRPFYKGHTKRSFTEEDVQASYFSIRLDMKIACQ
jgi:hypothetical protein